MFKTGLSNVLYNEFIDTIDNVNHPSSSSDLQTPYFYADSNGVKLIASLLDDELNPDSDSFATSVAGDGWLEVLSL